MNSQSFCFRTSPRWAILCALFALACGQKPRPGTPPKHLLVVTLENLRADHVTHLGYDRRTTGLLRPEQPVVLDIDNVGRTGVSFSRAYASSSDPELSLGSLLSGAHPIHGGAVNVEGLFASDQPTLAQSFQEAGFVTSCFVSSGSLADSSQSATAFGKGFDQAGFFATDEEALAAAVLWLGNEFPKGERHLTWIHLAGIQAPFDEAGFSDRHSYTPPDGEVDVSSADFVTQLEASGERPAEPHRQRLDDLYDARVVRTTELVNSFFFLYRNSMGVDGLWEDSLVAVAGVTGFELAEGEGQIGGRASLREEALRVPLMFTHVRSLTGERIFRDVVELRDLSAMFRDWFRVSEPSKETSRSLLAMVDSYIQREFPEYPALSVSKTEGSFSLRSARYRLVVRAGETELFDLEDDPLAEHDVAGAYPEIVAEFRRSSQARLASLGLSF